MRRAAWLYATVLTLALAVVALVQPIHVVAADRPGPVALIAALALVVPFAIIPYLTELLVSSRLGPSGGVPAPLPVDAREAVRAEASTRGAFATLAVVTAVVEELLFRGAVFADLRAQNSLIVAVALSSIVFGLHHIAFGVAAVVGKSVAGALWAALYVLGGTVLIAMASHLAFQYLVARRLRRVGA